MVANGGFREVAQQKEFLRGKGFYIQEVHGELPLTTEEILFQSRYISPRQSSLTQLDCGACTQHHLK